jgi:hypothetical protein
MYQSRKKLAKPEICQPLETHECPHVSLERNVFSHSRCKQSPYQPLETHRWNLRIDSWIRNDRSTRLPSDTKNGMSVVPMRPTSGNGATKHSYVEPADWSFLRLNLLSHWFQIRPRHERVTGACLGRADEAQHNKLTQGCWRLADEV